MSAEFSPLPDDEPMITLPEFLRRLKNEPEFVAKMRAHYEAALALPDTPDTTAMREAAGKALQTLKHHQGAYHAKERLREAEALMEAMDAAHLPRISELVDEAVDHTLDIMEPERTKFMKAITSIQSELRRLAARH